MTVPDNIFELLNTADKVKKTKERKKIAIFQKLLDAELEDIIKDIQTEAIRLNLIEEKKQIDDQIRELILQHEKKLEAIKKQVFESEKYIKYKEKYKVLEEREKQFKYEYKSYEPSHDILYVLQQYDLEINECF